METQSCRGTLGASSAQTGVRQFESLLPSAPTPGLPGAVAGQVFASLTRSVSFVPGFFHIRAFSALSVDGIQRKCVSTREISRIVGIKHCYSFSARRRSSVTYQLHLVH
jgi:hypothetical protein